VEKLVENGGCRMTRSGFLYENKQTSNLWFLGNSLCRVRIKRGKWVRSLVNNKEASTRFMLEGPCPRISFYTHWLCMNYMIAKLLLGSNITHDLLYFTASSRVNPQNSKQKHATKNFARFHKHFTLFTMEEYNSSTKIPKWSRLLAQ